MKRSDSATPSDISVSLHHIRHTSTENLERAARHYKRTLTALRADSFEQLPDATLQKLMAHLADGLRAVEEELRRRGMEHQRLPTAQTWPDEVRPQRGGASHYERDSGFAPVSLDRVTESGRMDGHAALTTHVLEEETE